MSIIIRDPINGVARLLEEQVTKNAIDINNSKAADIVLSDRITNIEAGANLGGANLVRFAFLKDGLTYYRVNNFSLTIPSTWLDGDYVEIYSSRSLDIPAYGYISNGELVLTFLGDFTTQLTELRAVDSRAGAEADVTGVTYTTFTGTSLLELDANNSKGQLVTIINDISRNMTTQYVSFDLNRDNIWSWVYIGPVGQDGKDGYSIKAFSTQEQYDTILLTAIAGNVLLDGAGILFDRGELRVISTLNPLVLTSVGNILGPQGIQGIQGNTGATALAYTQIITKDSAPEATAELTLASFNRVPVVGDTFLALWRDTLHNKSYVITGLIDSLSPTYQLLSQLEVTGMQGIQGIKGDIGEALRVKQGIYSYETLPVFSTTAEGDAYIVLDTSGPTNTYTLNIHAYGATDYTTLDNWNGQVGPAPQLTFTLTDLPAGSQGYATAVDIGNGSYTINLYLPAGTTGPKGDKGDTGDDAVLESIPVTGSITLGITHANKLLLQSGGTVEVIIPLNSAVEFPIDTEIAICRMNTFQTTLKWYNGVTVNGLASLNNSFTIIAQYGTIAIKKVGTDAWIVTGGY